MDTIKEYDDIIKVIVYNVYAERQINGKILLWDFQEDNDWDRLYFNVALIVSDLEQEDVYLQMPFFKYLKMKWKRRKRKNLRYVTPRIKNNLSDEGKTSVFIIMDYIRSTFGLSESKFKEINDEYYGWID